MLTIHAVLFASHILFGSLALMLVWIPVIAKKGGLNHVKFGKFYANTMYAVALSGALMALIVIADPIAIKGHLLSGGVDQQTFVNSIRIFWSFLLYLSLITYTSVRQGFAVLHNKQDTRALRKITHLGPLVLLMISAVGMLILGIVYGQVLHTVFAVLGLMISTSMLRYCLNVSPKPKQWLVAHLSAMLGSAIGAYTAFFAFGGKNIFSELGSAQIIFWIAPGVIGGITIYYFSRKYQPRA